MTKIIVLSIITNVIVNCFYPFAHAQNADEKVVNEIDKGSDKMKIAEINTTDCAIAFDPKICPRTSSTLHWGLGSVSVSVIGKNNDYCSFKYTNEIEGGYNMYECQIPISESSVEMSVCHGKPQISFDIKKCKFIRSSNLLDFNLKRKTQ